MPKYDVPYMLMLTRKLHDKKIITSCLTCVNFDEPSEGCKLTTPPTRPPASIIAYGCGAWDEGLPY
jgi:hypothetical protein